MTLAMSMILLVSAIIFRGITVSEQTYNPQVPFDSEKWHSYSNRDSKVRQRMIRDLITRILPGKSKVEIETLLGKSATHQEMRRHLPKDFTVKKRGVDGNWLPYPRTGKGYYFDELEWDLIYEIGREQILIWDHKGQAFSADEELLIIRLDENQRFKSWFIEGSPLWAKVVGPSGFSNYIRFATKHPQESTNPSPSLNKTPVKVE